MSPEEEAFAESFDCMVIEPMSGEMMNDPRQFAIPGFRRAAFEKDQLHDDALWCVGFTRILGLRKETRQAFFPELAQPASDVRVTESERLRLFRWSADFGQTGGNGVIALLDFASDGDSAERKGELCGHPLTSGQCRVNGQWKTSVSPLRNKESETGRKQFLLLLSGHS